VLTGDPLRAPQRGMLVPLLFLPLYYVLPLGGSVAPGRFLGALPFNLSDVRIHGDTFFGRAQGTSDELHVAIVNKKTTPYDTTPLGVLRYNTTPSS
jgi:hypothetical protein